MSANNQGTVTYVGPTNDLEPVQGLQGTLDVNLWGWSSSLLSVVPLTQTGNALNVSGGGGGGGGGVVEGTYNTPPLTLLTNGQVNSLQLDQQSNLQVGYAQQETSSTQIQTWTSGTALNTTIVHSCAGYANVTCALAIQGTVTGGTVTFETQSDSSGLNWQPISMAPSAGIPNLYSTYPLSNGTVALQMFIGGFYQIRMRLSGTISGSGSVTASMQMSVVGTEFAQVVNIVGPDGLTVQDLSATGFANTNGLLTAIGPTQYVTSSNNSSTLNVGPGAQFVGVIENAFNEPQASILFQADQPGILTINQFITTSNTSQCISTNFPTPALTGGNCYGRSFTINGNYLQVIWTNLNGSAGTTFFNLNTTYGTIAPTTQLLNTPTAINEVNGYAITGKTVPVTTSIINTPAAPATASVTPTSSQAVASNSTRTGLIVTNLGAVNVYFGCGNPAIVNGGIALTPNGTWVMDTFTYTQSAINAICLSGSSTLAIQEYN